MKIQTAETAEIAEKTAGNFRLYTAEPAEDTVTNAREYTAGRAEIAEKTFKQTSDLCVLCGNP